MTQRRALMLTLAGSASLGACATSGKIDPSLDAVAALPPVPDAYQAAVRETGAPLDNWLGQFNDPSLEVLVTEALAANPSLEAQRSALAAVRATSRAARGRRQPNVSASAGAGATTLGTDRFDDPTVNLDLGLSASWEADLWGRLDAQVRATEADALASEADLAAAELSVAAQTAIAWFDLKTSLARLDIAEKTLFIRTRTLELTERRLLSGSTQTSLDVRTARSSVAQAEATIAASRLDVGNAQRRLEILLGRYPAAEIATDPNLPTLTPIPMGGDPLVLLARRPDIAAAEARLLAAGLRAEAARLTLRPSLTLTGGFSVTGEDFDDLFDLDGLVSRATGSLLQPIFNGGALEADAEAALARARQALANYVSAALSAWQDVEDALQADTLLDLQEQAQRVALDEAIEAERIAERQYTNGLTNIFNLISAQDRRLSAESALISARSARTINRINYHLALGGGVPLPTPTLTQEPAGNSDGAL